MADERVLRRLRKLFLKRMYCTCMLVYVHVHVHMSRVNTSFECLVNDYSPVGPRYKVSHLSTAPITRGLTLGKILHSSRSGRRNLLQVAKKSCRVILSCVWQRALQSGPISSCLTLGKAMSTTRTELVYANPPLSLSLFLFSGSQPTLVDLSNLVFLPSVPSFHAFRLNLNPEK